MNPTTRTTSLLMAAAALGCGIGTDPKFRVPRDADRPCPNPKCGKPAGRLLSHTPPHVNLQCRACGHQWQENAHARRP